MEDGLSGERAAHFPPREDGSRKVIIFLTLCARQRRPLLANAEAAKLIVEAWLLADRWAVGRYVIMPDHLHLFLRANFGAGISVEELDRVLEKSHHASLAPQR